MSVAIGISPICWQNDDLPDLTADFSMEQALGEARAIGYRGVERGQRMPADTDGLRARLEAHDLALCGGWCSGHLLAHDLAAERAAIRAQLDQFVALGAPCLVYSECSNTVQGDRGIAVNDRPRLSREEIAAYGRTLGELAKWARDQGMPIAYHHHMGSIIESEADLDALMAASPPELGLCFDTGHLRFGGGDVMATLKRWSHRLTHMHYKDIRPDILARARAEGLSFLDAVIAGAFTVPGDGAIDFGAVTDHLAAIGYDGWIVVEAEQDPAKAPPYRYSQMGYEAIVAACAAAGLEIR